MGFFSDVWRDIKDTASDLWDDLKDGDILGAIGGVLEVGFTIGTGGLYNAGKVAVTNLLDVSVPKPENDYKDRKVMTRGASNPRQIVYGRARVGAQLVYIESSGTDSEFLHIIGVFAAHQCEQIKTVYFNDDIAILNGAVEGKYVGFLEFSEELGTQAVANSFAVSNAPSWDNENQLLGQTYMYFKLKYDREVYQSGVPSVTAIVFGKNDIYDPRDLSTGYTDNHALCIRDYLVWDRGLDIPETDISEASFIACADIDDELVAANLTGGAEKRYTINGTMKFNTAPLENLISLNNAGQSITYFSQGEWFITPGSYIAPSNSFNEDDLNGPIRFAPGSGKAARLNIGKGTYISERHDYEPVDFVQIAVIGYVASDLEELPADFNYPLTNSGTMARRLAKISIEQSRFGLGVSVTLKYRAMEVVVGDRITLSIDRLGWDNKIFRVEGVGISLDAGVELALREDSPDIYDWQEGEALNVEVPPPLTFPDPFVIEPPVIDSVTEELYFTNVASEIKTRLTVGWTAGISAVAFDVQYSFNGGAWVEPFSNFGGNPVQLDDFQVGDVQIRVRAINGIGVRSDWSAIFNYEVIGKTAPPPDVEKMYISGGILAWEYINAPLDLKGFLVRYHSGNKTTWGDAIQLHQGVVSSTTFNVLDLVFGLKTFLVKAVDTTGNESVNPATVIFGLGDPVLDNIFRTISYFGLGFPGTIVNGSINGSGYIVADQNGLFYNPDAQNTLFYDQDGSSLMYEEEYLQLEYYFSFTPDPADLPGSATANFQLLYGSNARIDLDYADNGVYSQFTGKIPDLELKPYNFRVVVPSQFTASPPTITEVEVVVDVPDIREVLNDVPIAIGGTRLPITETYREITAVTLTLQDDATDAATVKQVDRNPTLGPLIQIYDDTGAAVSGNIDATIGGY